MTQHPSFQISVMFASLVGAAGFVLATQAWLKFRGGPFGTILGILPVFMLIIASYHPILIIFPEYHELALTLESIGFALLVVFTALMLRLHWRLSPGRHWIRPGSE